MPREGSRRRLRDIGDARLEIDEATAVGDPPAGHRPADVSTSRARVTRPRGDGPACRRCIGGCSGETRRDHRPAARDRAAAPADIGLRVDDRSEHQRGRPIDCVCDGPQPAKATWTSGSSRQREVPRLGSPAIPRTIASPRSPDDSLIAFRSDRTPRGIYVALRLAASASRRPDGLAPRFARRWLDRLLDGTAGSQSDRPRTANVCRSHRRRGRSAGGCRTLASAGDPVWFPTARPDRVRASSDVWRRHRPRLVVGAAGGGLWCRAGWTERLRGQGLQLTTRTRSHIQWPGRPTGCSFPPRVAIRTGMEMPTHRASGASCRPWYRPSRGRCDSPYSMGSRWTRSRDVTRGTPGVCQATTANPLIFELPLDAMLVPTTGTPRRSATMPRR